MSNIEQNKKAVSVTQDNQLIESSYTLTLNEKRLMLLGMSKIDPRTFPKTCATFDLTSAEWQENFPGDEKPWRAMKNAAKKIMRRHITFHPKTGITEDVNWFDSVRYYEGEARVTVKFTYTITTRLQGMIEQFTSLNLLEVSKLTSFHSIRLYELLSQFRGTGYRRITLEDFRLSMNCTDSYASMKDLKRRVLHPALLELNEKSELGIECRDVKTGRKITSFEFILKKKDQLNMFS